MLAISEGSVLDKYTNNWSLHGLVERIQVKVSALSETDEGDLDLPLHINAHWLIDAEEIGRTFEYRFGFNTGEEIEWLREFSFTPDAPRYRTRLRGFSVEVSEAQNLLTVQWRPKGEEEWNDDPALWPLQVDLLEEEAEEGS